MSAVEQSIEAFAKQHNVDAQSVSSLVSFFSRAISQSAELRSIFMSDNEQAKEAAISEGVQSWYRQSQAFYKELLDNKTKRAQQYREEIHASLVQTASLK